MLFPILLHQWLETFYLTSAASGNRKRSSAEPHRRLFLISANKRRPAVAVLSGHREEGGGGQPDRKLPLAPHGKPPSSRPPDGLHRVRQTAFPRSRQTSPHPSQSPELGGACAATGRADGRCPLLCFTWLAKGGQERGARWLPGGAGLTQERAPWGRLGAKPHTIESWSGL